MFFILLKVLSILGARRGAVILMFLSLEPPFWDERPPFWDERPPFWDERPLDEIGGQCIFSL
jgi:hypothetical protein